MQNTGSTTGISRKKIEISEMIAEGDVSERVPQLILDGGLIGDGVETSLWDFKSKLPETAEDWAKTIKHAAAFHNSFGGYLVFGVEETKEGKALVSGILGDQPDREQFRAKLEKYLDNAPECTLARIKYQGKMLGLLHIPKRGSGANPAIFTKNGPSGTFKADDAYVRRQDESRPATGKDFEFLYSERLLPGVERPILGLTERLRFVNSPDRILICPKFVGRRKIIDALWKWISDEFERVRILAGEGGKGKTSIAFEFAADFASAAPKPFEFVLWLSAKRKQFSATQDSWVGMPQADFSDAVSLMKAMSEFLPTRPNLDFENLNEVKRSLKKCFNQLPSLVVIDDIDSLEPDEQKRVFELGHQVAQHSKFLYTTRANSSVSRDLCIQVSGFEPGEYRDFLNQQIDRFQLDKSCLAKSSADSLHKATDGSPLLTESILRLVKLGTPLHQAVKDWKGAAGEQAREAVLQKEIDRLRPEAKRALLALAHLGEASQAELGFVLGFTRSGLVECTEELTSLFLIEAGRITESEPRFGISSNAKELVLAQAPKLVSDHRVVERQVQSLRSGTNSAKGNQPRVRAAVRQAQGFLAQGDYERAKHTVETELKRQPGDRDLLAMLGEIALLHDSASELLEARKLFSKAYDAGQRKRAFFEKWYEAEDKAEYGIGMKEVAIKALRRDFHDEESWHYRKARGALMHGIARLKSSDVTSAIGELELAADEVSASIRLSKSSDKSDVVAESIALHDYIWNVAVDSGLRDSEKVDIAIRMIERGDRRTINYERGLLSMISFSRGAEGNARRFVLNMFDRLGAAVENAVGHSHGGVLAANIQSRLDEAKRQFRKSNQGPELVTTLVGR